MSDPELDRIHERYERRKQRTADRYSVARPEVLRAMQQVDRVTLHALSRLRLTDFPRLRILEVGCGAGGNLLQFLRWGADPANLVGNDLLEDRVDMARRRLPELVEIRHQDATTLDGEPFDIVLQSTVLSSILDDRLQEEVAAAMWRLTKPGGAVLSYDFTFDNPANRDVRKVPASRLASLFPDGTLTTYRVTLAPPVARLVGRVGPLHSALEAMPFLRTHLVATVAKPA
jgi:SAM-dependent methyltransferase